MQTTAQKERSNKTFNEVLNTTPNSFYQKYIVPNWSNAFFAVIAGLCLKEYYYEVTGRNIQFYAHFAYVLMILNSLSGFLKYTNDDTFSDLRVLLDYAQQVLCLPLIVTDFLEKYRMAPPELCVIPTILGLVTLFMFVIFEYKRQDLTDLNMIISLGIYSMLGVLYNTYAVIASIMMACGYFGYKRREGVCIKKANQYNLLMAGFAFFSLLSFDNYGFLANKNYFRQPVRGW